MYTLKDFVETCFFFEKTLKDDSIKNFFGVLYSSSSRQIWKATILKPFNAHTCQIDSQSLAFSTQTFYFLPKNFCFRRPA